MKTRFFSILTVSCLMTLSFLTNTFAQDSPQWHLPDGAIARFGKGEIGKIAYSPDGSRLAVASGIGTWIYNAFTGTEVALLSGQTGMIDSVAYSPDGRTLATGSHEEVLLWDATTGTLIDTLKAHSGYVVYPDVAYSPSGRTLATTSSLSSLKLGIKPF